MSGVLIAVTFKIKIKLSELTQKVVYLFDSILKK